MSTQKKSIMRDNIKIKLNNMLEYVVFVAYCMLHVIVSLKHEHWFDENVAYMIARYTSVKDILLFVPHYEGHPPLWHLVLKTLDCAGLGFESVMIVASTIFTAIAIWLLLMYSPFPRWIKLILPFTYFLFYQYGVIVRPYCMMMVAFFLMAITFKERNEQPFRFVFSMVFLCLTSAYGIIIAGGICIAWVIEIVKGYVYNNEYINDDIGDKRQRGLFARFLSDSRIKALFVILGVALLLIAEIMPNSDTHATNVFVKNRGINEIVDRAVYSFLCIIPDNTCYDVYGQGGVQKILVSVIGILMILILLVLLYKRQLTAFFIIPYILFSLFGSAVYMMSHHIGVITLFLIFIMWIALEKRKIDVELIDRVCGKSVDFLGRTFKSTVISGEEKVKVIRLMKIACYALIIYVLLVPVYWNVWASVYDMGHIYSDGKATAEFIKSNALDKYVAMADWHVIKDDDGKIEKSYPRITSSYSVIPYIGRNIYSYMEYGCNGKYDLHVQLNEDEENIIYENWRNIGMPAVIVGDAELSIIFPNGETLLNDEYVYVFSDEGRMVWKDSVSQTALGVYVRKDIAKELGLKAVPKPAVIKFN